jgi:hypothetical protein
MRKFLRLLAVAVALTGCSDQKEANPGFDFSAIEPFWAVKSTLESGQEPSQEQWDALLDTPGFLALTMSEFTPEFFRRNIELAFMPSLASEREEALAGPNGSYIKHYLHVAGERESLGQHLAKLKSKPIIPRIVQRARQFLPTDHVAGRPQVAFVIFANDGRAYDPIVVDLQASRNWDFESFLAHEFHHWFRNRALSVDFEAVDSLDYDLIWTLNQLQAEGIADQIDKRGWVLQGAEVPGGMSGYANRYMENLEAAPALLQRLDSLLTSYSKPGSPRGKIGAEIRSLVPQSGHPTGFYMASLILEHLGEGALIDDVGNPFGFVKTFARAAAQAPRTVVALSPATIDLLTALEQKYAKH